jgi:hypothetical protein
MVVNTPDTRPNGRGLKTNTGIAPRESQEAKDQALERARRTAFVARFIVLREGKRSRAHRKIEALRWSPTTTAEELAAIIRTVFKENGDKLGSVDRDIRRALGHATKTLSHFVREYESRCSVSFVEALYDYERSNELLFGHDERPKPGGWRMPQELEREFVEQAGR